MTSAVEDSEVSLLRSTDRSGEEKGNEVKQRAQTDETIGPNGVETIDFDAGPFTTHGVITGARIFVSSPGDRGLRFRIFRPFFSGVKTVGWTDFIETLEPGVQEVTFKGLDGAQDGVPFIPGDFLGWTTGRVGDSGKATKTTGSGVFPYDISGEALQYTHGDPDAGRNGVRISTGGITAGRCTNVGMKGGYEKRTYSYTVFTRPAVESDYTQTNLCNFGPGFGEMVEKMRSEGVFDTTTTTTTTPPEDPPEEDDAAAAVGDPHLTHGGKSFDLDESMVHH